MPPNIKQVISSIHDWQGREIEIQELTSGLTNTNYRLNVDGTSYVVRIPGASTELLAVDRANEIFNSKIAADSGVGPRVIYELPQDNITILEYISGKTMSAEELQDPAAAAKIARSLHLLHSSRRFLKDFNMFRLVEFYLKTAEEHQVTIPEDYREYLPLVGEIEAAVRVAALPTAPCHNDLLAENYIDDGRILRMVDYEYSGNNDPCFDLGNTCQELDYEDELYGALCQAYFGQEDPIQLARMHLFALMSDVGWTLWGAIQNEISQLDFDFWEYTETRWNRALDVLNSAELRAWLGQASAGP